MKAWPEVSFFSWGVIVGATGTRSGSDRGRRGVSGEGWERPVGGRQRGAAASGGREPQAPGEDVGVERVAWSP